MKEFEITDYYKLLESDIKDNYRIIYNRFKKLAKKYHPEFAGKDKLEFFLMLNEAYLILEYKEVRKLYDKFYRKEYLNELGPRLSDADYSSIKNSIQGAKNKANEISILPFKKYWNKIPKTETWVDATITFFADLV